MLIRLWRCPVYIHLSLTLSMICADFRNAILRALPNVCFAKEILFLFRCQLTKARRSIRRNVGNVLYLNSKVKSFSRLYCAAADDFGLPPSPGKAMLKFHVPPCYSSFLHPSNSTISIFPAADRTSPWKHNKPHT